MWICPPQCLWVSVFMWVHVHLLAEETYPPFLHPFTSRAHALSIRCSSSSLSLSPRNKWSRLVPRKLWEFIPLALSLKENERKLWGPYMCFSPSLVSSIFKFSSKLINGACGRESAMQFISVRKKKPIEGTKQGEDQRTYEGWRVDVLSTRVVLSMTIWGTRSSQILDA